jgi:predicted nucleic acid-binding protein
MIVVSDSSALVVLVRIGHGDVLPTLFKQVVIPPEVASELASLKWPQSVQDFIAAPPSWLEIRTPTSVEPIPNLHAGEAAAISLAQELQADRLIIDEKRGREAAAERHLRVIGTVGILEAAAERGLLDLEQAFEKVKQTDFWVRPKFLDERLALYRARELRREQKQARGPSLEP